MELKTVNPNSFNASLIPMMNPKIKIKANTSPYLNQIKELLNRRKADNQKNEYPFNFRKIEEGKQFTIKTIPKSSMKILTTTKSAKKITAPTTSKRLSYKSISIDTKNLIITNNSNSNVNSNSNTTYNTITKKKKETMRRNNDDKVGSEDFFTTGNMNKTSSISTPGIIITSESNHHKLNTNTANTNSKSSNRIEKKNWRVINTKIHFKSFEKEKLKKSNPSKNYNRKLIAFEKFLTATGSPTRSSHHHIDCFKETPVTIDTIKSLFIEYKQRKQITKSKSGDWLCNISPSLLYNSNYHTRKQSLSKDKESQKNSYVYPSNKLYK